MHCFAKASSAHSCADTFNRLNAGVKVVEYVKNELSLVELDMHKIITIKDNLTISTLIYH